MAYQVGVGYGVGEGVEDVDIYVKMRAIEETPMRSIMSSGNRVLRVKEAFSNPP